MSQRAKNQSAESSPAAVDENQDANPTQSSSVEPEDANSGGDAEESRESLLSVIQSVAGPDEGETEEPAEQPSDSDTVEVEDEGSDDEPEGEVEAEASDDDAADAEDEADPEKPPPFHEHPRWKAMVAERDAYREPAENYRRIESYMDSNGLTPEEVAEGFQIMALMKQRPAEAVQVLRSKLGSLQRFDPNWMPDDLRQEVETGAITEARAQELAQLRATGEQAQVQSRAQQQRAELTQREAQQARMQSVSQAQAQAVNAWEAGVKAKDLDYAKKAPWVQDRLRVLMQQEGRPDSAEAALDMSKRAYSYVNKQFKSLAPAQSKRPSRTIQSGGPAKATDSQPKSLQDAINKAVGK